MTTLSKKDIQKIEWEKFSLQENFSIIDYNLQFRSDKFSVLKGYLELRYLRYIAQEELGKLSFLNDSYKYINKLNEVQRLTRSILRIEEKFSQPVSKLNIVDDYKARATGQPIEAGIEVIRDSIDRPQNPHIKPKYPKRGLYVWRTQADSKVRKEHAERHGYIFKFEDPPIGSHPGENFNCRCWAEPLPDIWTQGLGDIFKKD